MKPFFSFRTVITVIVMLFCFNYNSIAQTVTIPTVSAPAGQVIVPISFTNWGNVAAFSIQIDIANVVDLAYTGSQNINPLFSGFMPGDIVYNSVNKTILMAWYNGPVAVTNGTLVELVFNYTGTATVPVTFSTIPGQCELSDIYGNVPPTTWNNGSVSPLGTPPNITTQPSATTICSGANTSFSVTATGTSLSYQWQRGIGAVYTNISGGIIPNDGCTYSNYTTNTLTLTNVPFAMNTFTYKCIVTGSIAPAATSNAAILTVNSVPTSGAIGTNQTICNGDTPASLTSTTPGTGSGAITYEWQTNATGTYVTIPGANSATYQPPTLTSTTSYQRRTVAVSGATCYSAYTTAVTITVSPPSTTSTTISSVSSVAGTVVVPILFTNWASVAAFSIKINISDIGVLAYTGSQNINPLFTGFTPSAIVYNSVAKTITMSWFNGPVAVTNGTLVELVFTYSGTTTGYLTYSTDPGDCELADILGGVFVCPTWTPGAVTPSTIGYNTNSFTEFQFEIYPNPISANTSLNFNLPEEGKVKLSMYNMMGELVEVLYDGNSNGGYHSYELKNLPAGLYNCVLVITNNGKTEITTKKLTIK